MYFSVIPLKYRHFVRHYDADPGPFTKTGGCLGFDAVSYKNNHIQIIIFLKYYEP